MKITGEELMKHCIEQTCETDYEGNIEYTVYFDELLEDTNYMGEQETRIYAWDNVLDYVKENLLTEEELKEYSRNSQRLNELKEMDTYYLSYEEYQNDEEEIEYLKTYLKNGWYERFDFDDWEHSNNENLVDFFEEWATDINKQKLITKEDNAE